ncbi:NAD(P)-dependent alcohol dehydrogenase [Pseudonocardia sp. N23]|uniref:NAD(P)-dependent alcohol dehydrogenase n=1 Tax=Pseudonocardia sp. N23 TaxID=1987376 RepID=UPI000C033313|nr:NAD(P)-dependent alcohol dehydrogenase [Pseudonocardia sp. N23]GAY13103.1 probable oxidoreductase, Zn-binding [Pseudonocardia sp. N23]
MQDMGTGVATTMRAVVQERYGEAGVVMRPARVPRPAPGPGEVLVRVHAAGVDRSVWHLTTGLPWPARLAGYGVRAPRTPVRGADLAGTVEEVGPGVSEFAPGDAVFGVGRGAYAEFALASPAKLAAMPGSLSFEAAASLPISGLTALQAVRDHARVAAGQSVLVLGASGGVGVFATQIARADGGVVTGVCGPGKAGVARAAGAMHVLDHTRDEITGRFDVILDIGGNRTLRTLRRLLTARGTLVIIGGETGGKVAGGVDRQLRAIALSPFVSQRLTMFVSSETAAGLRVLAGMAEAGTVAPIIDRTYPLESVPEAIDDLAAGRVRGKVVVKVAEPA